MEARLVVTVFLRTCNCWGFWWIQLVVTLLFTRFFSCHFPGKDTKTLAYLSLFSTSTCKCCEISICNPSSFANDSIRKDVSTSTLVLGFWGLGFLRA